MFIGQDSDTIDAYARELPEDPIEGVTLYTSLLSNNIADSLPAVDKVANWGAGNTDFKKTLAHCPSASVAIGLSMAQCDQQHLKNISEGNYDESISRLADFFKANSSQNFS